MTPEQREARRKRSLLQVEGTSLPSTTATQRFEVRVTRMRWVSAKVNKAIASARAR
jgi:hypothetical protein